MVLIIDTGPIVALLNASDDLHVPCSAPIKTVTEPLIIPAPVIVEVDYWNHQYLGPIASAGFLRDIVEGAFVVENLNDDDLKRVAELCTQYADSGLGFVDAAVLAVVERLKEPKLATIDHRHFHMLRPRHVAALELLPHL